MTIVEILEYVQKTPENINVNILKNKLEALVAGVTPALPIEEGESWMTAEDMVNVDAYKVAYVLNEDELMKLKGRKEPTPTAESV